MPSCQDMRRYRLLGDPRVKQSPHRQHARPASSAVAMRTRRTRRGGLFPRSASSMLFAATMLRDTADYAMALQSPAPPPTFSTKSANALLSASGARKCYRRSRPVRPTSETAYAAAAAARHGSATFQQSCMSSGSSFSGRVGGLALGSNARPGLKVVQRTRAAEACMSQASQHVLAGATRDGGATSSGTSVGGQPEFNAGGAAAPDDMRQKPALAHPGVCARACNWSGVVLSSCYAKRELAVLITTHTQHSTLANVNVA